MACLRRLGPRLSRPDSAPRPRPGRGRTEGRSEAEDGAAVAAVTGGWQGSSLRQAAGAASPAGSAIATSANHLAVLILPLGCRRLYIAADANMPAGMASSISASVQMRPGSSPWRCGRSLVTSTTICAISARPISAWLGDQLVPEGESEGRRAG